MLNEGLNDRTKRTIIKSVIDKVVRPKGFKMIRANIDDFDTPSKLSRRDEQKVYVPDITAVLNGRKSYFEVALKTDGIKQLITKWKLLSNVARFKEGNFFVLAPKGHLAFVNRILKENAIRAQVIKI